MVQVFLNRKLEMMWKETVTIQFKVISKDIPGKDEEKQGKPQTEFA
jgi:hypothetical protein